jgi:hypothetical protein
MSLNGSAVSVRKVGFGTGPLFPFNAQATRTGRFRGVPVEHPCDSLSVRLNSTWMRPWLARARSHGDIDSKEEAFQKRECSCALKTYLAFRIGLLRR